MRHDKVLRRYKGLLFVVAMVGISSIFRIEDKTMYYVVSAGVYAILILLSILILRRQRKLREENGL
jgi:hypothetical protein